MNEFRLPDGFDSGIWDRVEAVVDSFEIRWNVSDNDNKPQIEDYLKGTREPETTFMLFRLLQSEVDLRNRMANKPHRSDYLKLFPQHVSVVNTVFGQLATGQFAQQMIAPQPGRGAAGPIAVDAGDITDEPDVAAPGVRRFGNYELSDELGRGAGGIVYKARQISLDRLVALKIILAGQLASEQDVKRFRSEAQAAANLDHPNIVPVYEVGQHAGRHFFSMGYIQGQSLAEKVASGPLAPREAAELVKTVAEALEHAHQQGIIHRDIKPANIMLDSQARPRVTDFGLARQMGSSNLTRTGDIVGTPSYMSPEQAEGRLEDVGPASDVYAVGATLYDVLTGRPPFRADTPLETLIQVQQAEPAAPSVLNPRVPAELDTICLKCLEKQSDKRYDSAQQLADDLGRFLRGEPILARPPSRLQRALKWARRRPATAALVGVTSLAAAVLLAVGLIYNARLQDYNVRLQRSLDDTKQAKLDAENQRAVALRSAEQEAAAKQEADRRRKKAQDRLVRHHVTRGRERLDAGQLLGSLPWFAAALKEDAQNPVHRVRLAAVLRQSPKPVQIWFHEKKVNSIQFSEDGLRVLTASDDGTARVWDVAEGNVAGRPLAHGGAVECASFSPDGRSVVTTCADGAARVWDLSTWEPVGQPLKPRHPVTHAAFSPDGNSVVTASGVKNKPQSMRYMQTGSPTRTMTIPGPMRTMQIPNGRGGFTTIQVPGPSQTITMPGSGSQTPIPQTPIGRAEIWDLKTGKPIVGGMRARGWVNHVAFSKDGLRIATAGGEATGSSEAAVWDARTGEAVTPPLSHPLEVNRVAFSPDGRRLVTASGGGDISRSGEARIWDAVTGEPVGQPIVHGDAAIDASFSPDGSRVVTASSDGSARVCDAATGELLLPPLQHEDRLTFAAFSPDGRCVLTASWDGTAQLWDANSGEPLCAPLQHSGPVACAAFGPLGRRVATATTQGIIRIWDLGSTASLNAAMQHEKPVSLALFGSGRRRVLSSSGGLVSVVLSGRQKSVKREGLENSALVAWDVASGQPAWRATLDGSFVATGASAGPRPRALSVSPDGTRVAILDRRQRGANAGLGIRIMEVDSGEPVHLDLDAGVHFNALQFLADGGCYAVGVLQPKAPETGWQAQVWDVFSGQPVASPLKHDGRFACTAIDPNGNYLAVVTVNDAARSGWQMWAWNLRTGELVSKWMPAAAKDGPPREQGRDSPDPDRPPSQILFTGDGRRVVTVAGVHEFDEGDQPHGHAAIWDVVEGGLVARLRHRGAVTSVRSSHAGDRIVTASADRTARVWDATTGDPVTPPLAHTDIVYCAEFGPRGEMVVTASADGTARVWNALSGEPITPPLQHDGQVIHASFASDGERIVTAGLDRRVKVWQLSPDPRPVPDLVEIVSLLAGHQIDPTGGYAPLDADTTRESWQRLRQKYPNEFQCSIDKVAAWHRQQADNSQFGRNWRAADLHLTELIRLEPERPELRVRRADARGWMSQWSSASDDYTEAISQGVEDAPAWHRHALLLLKLEKKADYGDVCEAMLKRISEVKGGEETVIRTCVLGPEAVDDYSPLLQAAEKADAEGGKGGSISNGTRGALLYRSGRPDETIEMLAKSANARPGPSAVWDWLFLAMAHHQAGDDQQANAFLDTAGQSLDQARQDDRSASRFRRLHWSRQLELDLLRREATAVVAKKNESQ